MNLDFGPLRDFQDEVARILEKVIGLSKEKLMKEGVLVPPNKNGSCDFVLNVNKLYMFKKDGFIFPNMSANKIAWNWANDINAIIKGSVIEHVTAEGSYINIFLETSIVTSKVIYAVLRSVTPFGTLSIGNGEKVFIEYSSPNIAKPFHAGHLRSTIIGSFLCKLHELVGFKVVSENYLGDWGKQYGLLALAFTKYGNEEELKQNPIKHLFDLYVRINQEVEFEENVLETIRNKNPNVNIKYHTLNNKAKEYFTRMEDGDEEVLELWRRMRNLSIQEYTKMYERLNIVFDFYGGESEHFKTGKEQLKIMREHNLLLTYNHEDVIEKRAYEIWENRNKGERVQTKEDDWEQAKSQLDEELVAKYVEFSEDTNLGKILLTKKDGSTLYITRDLAAAATRWNEHNFHKMIYVVAMQQNHHFAQLFELLKMMGYEWYNRCFHVSFGLVKGMSTRKGKVVFLSDILGKD